MLYSVFMSAQYEDPYEEQITSSEPGLDYYIQHSLEGMVKEFYNQMQNAADPKDRRDAAAKLHDIMQKNKMMGNRQFDEIPPIEFDVKHFRHIVDGLSHLARYGGLEKRFKPDSIARALDFLTTEEAYIPGEDS